MPSTFIRPTILVSFLLAAVPLVGQSEEAMVLGLDGQRVTGSPSFERSNITITPADGGARKNIHPATIWHLFMSAPPGNEDGLPPHAIDNRPPGMSGLVLTNGAFVAGQPEKITSESVSVFTLRADTLTFPREQVARVQFSALSDSARVVLPEFATGVVSKSGHFSEGDIISFDEKEVVVDSIMAGPSTHSTNRLHAVVLASAPLASSDYILELTDGSLLLADRLSLQPDALQISGLLTGEERIEADDLARLSAGSRRVSDLTELPYRRRRPEVDGGSGLTLRTSPLMATPVRVDGTDRVVEIPAGNAIASILEQDVRGFSVRLAVPSDQPAQNRVIFKIRDTNRQIYESPPMSSEDRPLLVGLRERIARFIILEVLPADERAHETPGLWIEPVLHTE